MKDPEEFAEKSEDTSDLSGKEPQKWYFAPWAIVTLIICFGPLGLIPLWLRPKTKMRIKVLVSAVVAILAYLMMREVLWVYKTLMVYYRDLGEVI
jgi:hypothetical protein